MKFIKRFTAISLSLYFLFSPILSSLSIVKASSQTSGDILQATGGTLSSTSGDSLSSSDKKILPVDSSGETLASEDEKILSSKIDADTSGDTFDIPNLQFTTGIFEVGKSGQVSIDFIFDGGGYKGELAVFSLEDMSSLTNQSDFIKEAAKRALSNSPQGHIVISDIEEGAKFDGPLDGERNYNYGPYLGLKSFYMNPQEKFGIMLVPNGRVLEVFNNPSIGGKKSPLFSMATSNPNDIFYYGQIGKITGGGTGFSLEDLRMDGNFKSDKDYNDIIFQFKGATGKAPEVKDLIDPKKNWLDSDLGKQIIEYISSSSNKFPSPPEGQIFFENKNAKQVEFTNSLDDLNIIYTAKDNTYPIKGIRFSNDGFNWYTQDSLPITNCPRISSPDQKNPQSILCNQWPGQALNIKLLDHKIPGSLLEGRIYKFMEITDEKGFVAIVSSSFVFDKTPPSSSGKILIGHFEYDISNPQFTSKLQNYATFQTHDQNIPVSNPEVTLDKSQISNIDSVRFSITKNNEQASFADWQNYEDQETESIFLKWPSSISGDILQISMQAKDKAGNISKPIKDAIVFKNQKPQATLLINNNEQYTKESTVALRIHTNDKDIEKMRFKYCNETCENEEFKAWKDFKRGVLDTLNNPLQDGTKTICLQIKNKAANLSNEVCDTIVLDTTPPKGSILINNGASKSNSKNVSVNISAEESNICNPNISNCLNPSGQIKYSISLDQKNWSSWKNCSGNQDLNLNCTESVNLNPNSNQAFVFVKFKDGLNNQSEIFQDNIFIDTTTYSSRSNSGNFSGSLEINNQDAFTQSQIVILNIQKTGHPSSMKIWNSDQNPQNVLKQPFESTIYWKLSQEDGLKRVNIQLFGKNKKSNVIFDEIIKAPFYKIDYKISSLPSQVQTLDTFEINLNVTNQGSQTWLPKGENPVRISYHWYKRCSDNSCSDKKLYEWDGARASLNQIVSYNQTDENISLKVYTPDTPGEYILEIDAVEEGITWFSEQGNETPSYTISLNQNPDFPLDPNPESSGSTLPNYTGEFGIGADELKPIVENVHYFGGTNIDGIIYTNNLFNLGFSAKYVDPAPNPSNPEQAVFSISKLASFPTQNNPNPKVIKVPCSLRFSSSSSRRAINSKPNRRFLENKNPAYWGANFVTNCIKDPDDYDLYFSNGIYIIKHRVEDKAGNRSSLRRFSQVFVLDRNFDPSNPPITKNPVISINKSYMTPIVSGTACGHGNKISSDALQATITNWKDSFILQARLKLGGGNFSTWINLGQKALNRGVFEVKNSTATFLLPHTDSYPEGPATWQLRVLNKSKEIGKRKNLDFLVTRDLQHLACGYSTVLNKIQEDKAVSISTIPVPLRMGPSNQFSAIGKVDLHESFTILQKNSSESDPWYYIKLENGKTGWIPANFVHKDQNFNLPVLENKQKKNWYGQTCNLDQKMPLKMAPSWEARNMYKTKPENSRYIDNNEKLLVIDEIENWYKVVLEEDLMIGFVHKAYVCKTVPNYEKLNFGLPIEGEYELTFPYAPRQDGFHYADDFGIACNTPVKAVQDGIVSKVENEGIILGNQSTSDTPANSLTIRHEKVQGSNRTFDSYYVHLNEIWVQQGDLVKKGETIGLSGNTGYVRGNPNHPLEKQGCHLHLEIHEITEESSRNPMHVLNEEIDEQTKKDLQEKYLLDLDDKEILDNLEYGTGSKIYNPSKATITINLEDKGSSLEYQNYIADINPPYIQQVKPTSDQKYVYIHGVSTKKLADYTINTTKKKSFCLINCIEEENSYTFKQTLDHVGIQIYKKRIGKDLQLSHGFVWVKPNGTWSIKIPLDENLNMNDKIYAKTKIWDSLNNHVDGDKINSEFLYNIMYAEDDNHMISKPSNIVKILKLEDNEIVNDIKIMEKEEDSNCSNIKGMYDVCPSYPFYEYIKNLLEDNIVNGYSDGNFYPDKSVTRAQMSKFVVNAFNIPKNHTCPPFPDANPNNYPESSSERNLYGYATTLKCEGIISGYSDGTFKPNLNLTRGQAAKFIVNGSNLQTSNSCTQFPDISRDNIFYDYIKNLKCNGIVNGFSDGEYKADRNISRGEMAKIVDNVRFYITSQEEQTYGLSYCQPFQNKTSCTTGKIRYCDDGEIHKTDKGTFVVKDAMYEGYIENGGFDKFGFATTNVYPWHANKYGLENEETNGYIQNFTKGFATSKYLDHIDWVTNIHASFTPMIKTGCFSYLNQINAYSANTNKLFFPEYEAITYNPSTWTPIPYFTNGPPAYKSLYTYNNKAVFGETNDTTFKDILTEDIEDTSKEIALTYLRFKLADNNNADSIERLNNVQDYYLDLKPQIESTSGPKLLKTDYKNSRLYYLVSEIKNTAQKTVDFGKLLKPYFGNSIENFDYFAYGMVEYLLQEGLFDLVGTMISNILSTPILVALLIYGVVRAVGEVIRFLENYDLLMYFGEIPDFTVEELEKSLNNNGLETLPKISPEQRAQLAGRGVAKIILTSIFIVKTWKNLKSRSDLKNYLKTVDNDETFESATRKSIFSNIKDEDLDKIAKEFYNKTAKKLNWKYEFKREAYSLKNWDDLHPDNEIPIIKDMIFKQGDEFIGIKEIPNQKNFDGFVKDTNGNIIPTEMKTIEKNLFNKDSGIQKALDQLSCFGNFEGQILVEINLSRGEIISQLNQRWGPYPEPYINPYTKELTQNIFIKAKDDSIVEVVNTTIPKE